MLWIYIASLIIGFVLLVKGSDYFVDGAAGFATKAGIPQLVIGLTIVAMGTSVPEAAVSITAAFSGNTDITIGNIVGSNILNVFLILGISSVIVSLAVARTTIRYEIPYMIFCTLLLLFLGRDGSITRWDGLALWIAFLLYLGYLFLQARKNREDGNYESKEKVWKLVIYMLGGIAAIVAGSKFAVYGATELARLWGISERVIGLTIVALGTSLPELFTSVVAARKKNADIAIGNIVGSNIFNILFVVGTSSLLARVPFEPHFMMDTVIAIGAGLVLLLCSLPKKRLGRAGGTIMLLCYAGYLGYLFLF